MIVEIQQSFQDAEEEGDVEEEDEEDQATATSVRYYISYRINFISWFD